MSYAYIKNVYPDFQASKVYDNKVYNGLDSINQNVPQAMMNNSTPVPFETDEEARFARNLLAKTDINQMSLPQFNIIETMQNTPTKSNETVKDNLRYYNIPLANTLQPPTDSGTRKGDVETFEEPRSECKIDCDSHVMHVINCTRCKSVISRQFNLDNDRVRNEEFMELFSYVIFGVFILLLVDSLKNNE